MGIVAGKPQPASMLETMGRRFRKLQPPDEGRSHLSVMRLFGCLAVESKVSFRQCI